MNTVAFLNILIIRPETLRRESRRAFFRHRRLPLEPVARQSRADRRPQTEFKPRFFANFDCILFLAFLYIFYFWGICRVINKFATLPQDICIRNYGNEMLWSQANDRRRRRRRCAAVTGTATETGSGCGSGSAGTNCCSMQQGHGGFSATLKRTSASVEESNNNKAAQHCIA